jgi:hypothetical protein
MMATVIVETVAMTNLKKKIVKFMESSHHSNGVITKNLTISIQ